MKYFRQNKKSFFLSIFLFLFFSTSAVALTGIVPCGGSDPSQIPCKVTDLKLLFSNTLKVSFSIVSMIAVAMIVYTAAKLMIGQNKAVELSEAKERAWKVGTGILIFFGGSALIIMILKSVGLNNEFLNLFNFFFTAVLNSISASAYAVVDPTLLPAPISAPSLLDFFALLLRILIRWFVFPLILLSWLYAGFLYVKAQGNPEQLKDANKWLWWTLIGTVIIMLAETLFSVLRETITTIVS